MPAARRMTMTMTMPPLPPQASDLHALKDQACAKESRSRSRAGSVPYQLYRAKMKSPCHPPPVIPLGNHDAIIDAHNS